MLTLHWIVMSIICFLKVMKGIDDISSANHTAKDLVKAHLEKELSKKQKLLELKQNTWPAHVIGDLDSGIKVTEDRIGEIEKLLNCEDSATKQRLDQMRKRKATQLVEKENKAKKTG